MKDYIPPPDDQFHHWADDLVKYLTSDAGAPVLTPDTKTLLTNGLEAWNLPYQAHLTAQTVAHTNARAKDDARAVFVAILRKEIGDIQRDSATTDAQRTAMKVTIPKEGRTAVGEIESYPIFTKIDTSTRLRHRLFFADSETPGSAAKPEGARFCEIRFHLAVPGEAAPTIPSKMESLAMESRSPHRNDFDSGEEGRTAYYAARWINTTGDAGPWSPIVTSIVPG